MRRSFRVSDLFGKGRSPEPVDGGDSGKATQGEPANIRRVFRITHWAFLTVFLYAATLLVL